MNKIIQGVVPDFTINGIPLERVQAFNFFGLLLNENISYLTNMLNVQGYRIDWNVYSLFIF